MCMPKLFKGVLWSQTRMHFVSVTVKLYYDNIFLQYWRFSWTSKLTQLAFYIHLYGQLQTKISRNIHVDLLIVLSRQFKSTQYRCSLPSFQSQPYVPRYPVSLYRHLEIVISASHLDTNITTKAVANIASRALGLSMADGLLFGVFTKPTGSMRLDYNLYWSFDLGVKFVFMH